MLRYWDSVRRQYVQTVIVQEMPHGKWWSFPHDNKLSYERQFINSRGEDLRELARNPGYVWGSWSR